MSGVRIDRYSAKSVEPIPIIGIGIVIDLTNLYRYRFDMNPNRIIGNSIGMVDIGIDI